MRSQGGGVSTKKKKASESDCKMPKERLIYNKTLMFVGKRKDGRDFCSQERGSK